MIYKYKFLFDEDCINLNEFETGKTYKLDDKYNFFIKINKDIKKNVFNSTLKILDRKNNSLDETKCIRTDLFDICDTHYFVVEGFDRIRISIFNKNLSDNLNDSYLERQLDNAIRATDFTNYFELADLSILMIRYGSKYRYNGLDSWFLDKAEYYGYDTYKEILKKHTDKKAGVALPIDAILSRLIRKKRNTNTPKDIADFYCSLATIYINGNLGIRAIWTQVELYINEMNSERLDGLKPYFNL